jgi:hypothetical protein
MLVARGNSRPIRICADLRRNGSHGSIAEAKRAVFVATPAIQRVLGGNATNMRLDAVVALRNCNLSEGDLRGCSLRRRSWNKSKNHGDQNGQYGQDALGGHSALHSPIP